MSKNVVAVVGGGPAGLMAADCLASAGCPVVLFDAMPSPGRKFLMAGRGGLNLTHSEPFEIFLSRYGERGPLFAPMLAEFGPDAVRRWAEGLGIATFIGTSGRVFPAEMKAAPLLRAWIRRLRGLGVEIRVRHRWLGPAGQGRHRFIGPDGETEFSCAAAILALGGASWPRLGSTGAWVEPLAAQGVDIRPLRPANCGVVIDWNEPIRRHQGTPLKNIAVSFAGRTVKGEVVITERGLEGGPVYTLAAALRDALDHGPASLLLDLKPDLDDERLRQRLDRPQGRMSFSNWLRKSVGLGPAAAALLRAQGPGAADATELSRRIKGLAIEVRALAPLAEAISSAGGIAFDEVDDMLMLRRLPGVFVAGEMLDWEAPTGGYLLTGCLATGRRAATGALRWLG